MRYPNDLKKGGTIGFVAPSFGCNTEPYFSAFQNAVKKWKQMGYQVQTGPNCYLGEGVGISNTPQLCGQELNEYLMGDTADILISCGGGEMMCEVMDYVDFEGLKERPAKWFMGFSDNTNLTYLLTTICDTASVYGPCAPAFGMEPWHPVLKCAMELLTGEAHEAHGYDKWEIESLKSETEPLLPYHLTEPKVLQAYPDIRKDEIQTMQGRLLGGCLDCLVNLAGTKYDHTLEFLERYRQDGFLWFLESCDLNPMDIRRAIWKLKATGWFQYVRGFLIGRPGCYGEECFGLTPQAAFLDLLQEYQVPVILDVDLGHLPPSMPIVCGSIGKAEVCNDEINLQYIYQ